VKPDWPVPWWVGEVFIILHSSLINWLGASIRSSSGIVVSRKPGWSLGFSSASRQRCARAAWVLVPPNIMVHRHPGAEWVLRDVLEHNARHPRPSSSLSGIFADSLPGGDVRGSYLCDCFGWLRCGLDAPHKGSQFSAFPYKLFIEILRATPKQTSARAETSRNRAFNWRTSLLFVRLILPCDAGHSREIARHATSP